MVRGTKVVRRHVSKEAKKTLRTHGMSFHQQEKESPKLLKFSDLFFAHVTSKLVTNHGYWWTSCKRDEIEMLQNFNTIRDTWSHLTEDVFADKLLSLVRRLILSCYTTGQTMRRVWWINVWGYQRPLHHLFGFFKPFLLPGNKNMKKSCLYLDCWLDESKRWLGMWTPRRGDESLSESNSSWYHLLLLPPNEIKNQNCSLLTDKTWSYLPSCYRVSHALSDESFHPMKVYCNLMREGEIFVFRNPQLPF